MNICPRSLHLAIKILACTIRLQIKRHIQRAVYRCTRLESKLLRLGEEELLRLGGEELLRLGEEELLRLGEELLRLGEKLLRLGEGRSC